MRKVNTGIRFLVLACVCGLQMVFSAALMAATPGSVLYKLAIPENASLAIVTSDGLYNGAPIAMATLTSSEPVNSVLSFYRKLWNDGDEQLPGYVESAVNHQQLISRMRDGLNIVLQLESTGENTTTGYVSVLALNTPQVTEDHGVFSDLESLSSHRTVDGADTSWMRVYASRASVNRTRELYLQRLGSNGWHVLADHEVQGVWVTHLSRSTSRLELTFLDSREYASMVVAHRVDSE